MTCNNGQSYRSLFAEQIIKLGRLADYYWFWIPIVCLLVGALVVAWLYKLFIGFHWSKDSGLSIVTVRKR
jgi:glycerol uptake facilitator-like aquaporin